MTKKAKSWSFISSPISDELRSHALSSTSQPPSCAPLLASTNSRLLIWCTLLPWCKHSFASNMSHIPDSLWLYKAFSEFMALNGRRSASKRFFLRGCWITLLCTDWTLWPQNFLWNDWMLLNLQVVVQRMVFYLFTPAAAAITAQTCVVPVCLVDSDDLLEIWNVLHWITNYPSEAVYRCWHVSSAGMLFMVCYMCGFRRCAESCQHAQ